VKSKRPAFAFATATPLACLLTVTMTAGFQKIFSADPRIGFLAQADALATKVASGLVAPEKLLETQTVIFNARLDAGVTALFMTLVAIVADAVQCGTASCETGAGGALGVTTDR
jgi:carbon starvation protein